MRLFIGVLLAVGSLVGAFSAAVAFVVEWADQVGEPG